MNVKVHLLLTLERDYSLVMIQNLLKSSKNMRIFWISAIQRRKEKIQLSKFDSPITTSYASKYIFSRQANKSKCIIRRFKETIKSNIKNLKGSNQNFSKFSEIKKEGFQINQFQQFF
jgi:hypothetical protein